MICPFATVRLLDAAYIGRNRITRHERVNFHVQAGTGSLFHFFNAPNRASSHFWVSYGGLIEQYQDTAYTAEADLDGNATTISIETEGGTGSTADTDPWTPAQVDALVRLSRWLMDVHGIPRVEVVSAHQDSRSHGQSWHRVGIDGNFPPMPDVKAGREQRGGGMRYSNSRGKVCPGGGKIRQVAGIVAQINGGGTGPIDPQEDDDMKVLFTDGKNPQVWIGDGVSRRKVATQDTLAAIQWLTNAGLLNVYANGAIQTIPDPWSMGHPIDS